MKVPYQKIHQLISRYYVLASEGTHEKEINDISTELTNCSNLREEKYFIHCFFRNEKYAEMVYISYAADIDLLVDFGNELCQDKQLENLIVVIFRSQSMQVLSKSTPLGMVFY